MIDMDNKLQIKELVCRAIRQGASLQMVEAELLDRVMDRRSFDMDEVVEVLKFARDEYQALDGQVINDNTESSRRRQILKCLLEGKSFLEVCDEFDAPLANVYRLYKDEGLDRPMMRYRRGRDDWDDRGGRGRRDL